MLRLAPTLRYPNLAKYSNFAACFHRQYQYVDIPDRQNVYHECDCYAKDLNHDLPRYSWLDINLKLPQKTPAYHKHLLLISPPDLVGQEPEWKGSWQRKLELNPKWPYSVIGELKSSLKNTRHGDGVLVNAMSIIHGELANQARRENTANILAIPDMKIYEIREKDIKEFANFIGGGARSNTLNFADYLKGAMEIRKKLETEDTEVYAAVNSFSSREFGKNLVLVCGHHQRDQRCGILAPRIIKKLQTIVEPETELGIVSHIGGHKYAGNLIFYNYLGRDNAQNAKVDGLWFGKILPTNVPTLVKNLNDGNIISEWFRGGISSRSKD